MTGYVRKDVTNNIADGNIINAADLDAEFDGVVDAFNASTGHTHGGGVGEGAPITTIGPTQDVVASAAALTPKTTNTVDIGSSSLKFKDFYLAGNANIAGTTTLGGALTYGGVTLSNAVTGTGNMVLSTSPTLTTPTLGVATATSINKVALTAPATGSTLTIADGKTLTANSSLTLAGVDAKTLTVNNSLTLAGTDATTMTFPATSATIARTDAAQTFTGTQTFSGAVSVQGNTTLGDASTDTVTVNGYIGVGGGATSSRAIQVSSSALTGTTQMGILSQPTANSAATSELRSIASYPVVADSAFTVPIVSAFYASVGFKGAAATATNWHGLYIADQTQGTNNYGITSLVSSGTNKWNIYASGTAANYFAGNVGIGVTPSGLARTEISGSAEVLRLTGTTDARLRLVASNTGSSYIGFDDTSANVGVIAYNHVDNSMRFNTNFTERLRIDSSGNVGIGTSSPSYPLSVSSAASTQIQIRAGNTSDSVLLFGDTDAAAIGRITYAHADDSLRVFTNNTERLRIDSSGNVGIGTSSPTLITAGSRALEVSGAGDYFPSINLARTGASGYTNVNWKQFLSSNGGLYFRQDSTDRLIIDSSGNLGLGVTPSAWVSTAKAIEVGGTGGNYLAFNTTARAGFIYTNAFWNGTNNIYKNNGVATAYAQDVGTHAWYIAPSGTAGAAITFTERASISATEFVVNNPGEDYDFRVESDTNTHALFVQGSDGNVGIGTSSPQAALHVSNTQYINSTTNSTIPALSTTLVDGEIHAGFNNDAAADSGLLRLSAAGGTTLGVKAAIDIARGSADASQIRMYTSGTERLRIDSSGNVGIGTSTPGSALDVNGAIASKTSDTSIYTTGALLNQKLRLVNSSTTDNTSVSLGFRSVNSLATEFGAAGVTAVISNHTAGSETAYLTFSTNNGGSFAERMRLDSSGNVSIGGTANRATTVGTKALNIFNGTAPVGTLTNGISIYSSAGEAYVMDAAGNATLFSPHDAETNEWIFKSKHTPTGKVLRIDVEKLLRFVNDHFGLDAVQEFIEP